MNDFAKSKEELINELKELRRKLANAEERSAQPQKSSCEEVERLAAGRTKELRDESERLRQAQKALAQSEAHYRIMGETLPYGVWWCDAEGRAEYVSPSFLELLDMTLEEQKEFGWTRRLVPQDIQPMMEKWLHCVRTGAPWDHEHRIVDRFGQVHTVLTRGLPVRDESGETTSWAGINLDITERKQLEEEVRGSRDELEVRVRERTAELEASNEALRLIETELRKSERLLQNILEALPVGVWITDKDGNILGGNSAARQVWQGARYVGMDRYGEYKGWWADTGKQIEPEEWALARAIRDGETSLGEIIDIQCFDGSRKTIVNSCVPVYDDRGQLTAAVVINHDITGMKRIEEELKRSNKELRDFTFIASHDLQEPLRKVTAFGDRLVAKYGDVLEGEGRDYIQRMQKAALRMSALVQDLLSYSRISTRAQPFCSTHLNGIVQEALLDLDMQIEGAGATVHVEDLAAVAVDAGQMRQVFQNLFSNAIKFRREEPPKVRVHGEFAESGGLYQVFVEDNGIGFDEVYLDRIFNPFQRLHGRTSPYQGTGIGLAICRKIIERHGGGITAKSTPNVGSTFIITLPAGACEGNRAQPPESE